MGYDWHVENFSSKYITNRNIDIWLPQDYNVNKKYVMYYLINHKPKVNQNAQPNIYIQTVFLLVDVLI